MLKAFSHIIIFLICVLSLIESKAQSEIDLSKAADFQRIDSQVDILVDSLNEFSFDQVKSVAFVNRFKKSETKSLNFGYTKHSHWFRFKVSNPNLSRTWLLQLGHPLADTISFHFVNNDGKVTSHYTGALFPISSRQYLYNYFIVKLPFDQNNNEVMIYINCRGNHSKQYPLAILSEKYFIQISNGEYTLIGVVTGILLAMAFYNFFLYISLREVSYLYYVGFIINFLILQISIKGYLHFITPVGWEQAAGLANIFFVGSTILFGNLFANNFLHIGKTFPIANYLLIFIRLSCILFMGATIVSLSYRPLIYFLPSIASLLAISSILIIFLIAVYFLFLGQRSARFYVLAWIAIFVGVAIYVLRNLGVLPNNIFTANGLFLGSTIEALLLAFGLADKINSIQKEKREAQEALISNLKQQEEQILDQNRTLEAKVEARTKELLENNKILEEQNIEIQIQKEEITAQRDLVEIQTKELQYAFEDMIKRNNETISSISYARRIQRAMLPTEDRFEEILGKENFFIIYKPKNLVSGDFYFLEYFNDKIFVAVGDCTGHGVPGALMSMISYQLLYETIIRLDLISPELILLSLHEEIRRFLRTHETFTNDGMDISIAVIDPKENYMHYAGAYNPLYYFQKKMLYEIKADKLSIGGEQHSKKKSFTKHELDLREFALDNTFYLFSDGYQDQFGGDKNRKFMIKNFKQLLEEIQDLPMPRQKEILEKKLSQWQANNEQTDDITLVGFKWREKK